MLATLHRRDFALILTGSFISLIGDWMLLIGLPLLVFTLTHSTLSTAFTFMVGAVPTLLFGQIAGVFVDRWNRQRILVVANVILALNLLPLLLVTSADTVWIVYIVQFIAALVGLFLQPAAGALLPLLIGEEQLVPANSLNALSQNLSRLIGPSLGGVAVVFLGLRGIALLDAASFIAAGAMAALIQPPPRAPQPARSATLLQAWASVGREMIAGMAIIHRERVLWTAVIATALNAIGEGIFIVLLIPFITHTLHGTGQDYGWFLGLQAVGGLIGSLIIGQFGKRASRVVLAGCGAVGLGLVDFAIFNYVWLTPALKSVVPALLLIMLAGVPAAAANIGGQTLVQQVTGDAYRGRVLAVISTAFALFNLFGSALAGFLGERFNTILVLNIHVVTLTLMGGLYLLLLRRRTVTPPPLATVTTSTPLSHTNIAQ